MSNTGGTVVVGMLKFHSNTAKPFTGKKLPVDVAKQVRAKLLVVHTEDPFAMKADEMHHRH